MYLQGDLQSMFDALYELGVIEPVLEMDWDKAMAELGDQPDSLFNIMQVVNLHSINGKNNLVHVLAQFDERSLKYLAMEVAREFADFHSREELH